MNSLTMEVTKTNFKEVLSKLPQVFKDAQFIAFDTEFTGLKVEGTNHINHFDTLEDVYTKDRHKAETFMAIQYGIVAFYYDEANDRYTHEAFNFYIYPSSLCPDTNFTCQATSLEFLVSHGFDFNKLIKDGIPYLRNDDLEKILAKLKEKFEKKMQLQNTLTQDMPIPYEHKSTIQQINKQIEEFLDSENVDTLTIGKHNSFVRRLIYQAAQEKFGSRIHMQTNKDSTMTISPGLTPQQLKDKYKKMFDTEKQEVLDCVGFSKVIKLIIESGKLFIGHNLWLDLLFTVRQFVQILPNTYKEFKQLAHFSFSKIIDTKFMASTTEFKGLKDTTLYNVLEHFQSTSDVPDVGIKENGRGYASHDQKCHEAAYDAYITGLCFLAMLNQLGKLNMTNIFKTVSTSPFIEPMLNRLPVPRLFEIPFMNIAGRDVEPCRSNVFHLTFPKDWQREDITKLFKNYGFLNMSWLTDTTAFVAVKKEHTTKVKQKLMKENKTYKLRTYKDFQDSQKVAKNEIQVDEDDSDSLEETSTESKSSLQGSSSSLFSSNGEKKRTPQGEDVGEVISRPQKKKMCSFENPPFD